MLRRGGVVMLSWLCVLLPSTGVCDADASLAKGARAREEACPQAERCLQMEHLANSFAGDSLCLTRAHRSCARRGRGQNLACRHTLHQHSTQDIGGEFPRPRERAARHDDPPRIRRSIVVRACLGHPNGGPGAKASACVERGGRARDATAAQKHKRQNNATYSGFGGRWHTWYGFRIGSALGNRRRVRRPGPSANSAYRKTRSFMVRP